MLQEALLLAGARTPIGSFLGSLSQVPASALGAAAARAALDRSGVQPEAVDHVVVGSVLHSERGAAYLARMVGKGAGVPDAAPALTVNRLCGSGLEAVIQASRLVRQGEAEVVLAGGAESMSQAPHWLWARRGQRLGDGRLTDALTAALEDPFLGIPMGATAEVLARRYGIDREAQDRRAVLSQRRAGQALAEGAFAGQVVPVEVGPGRHVAQDEGVRPDSTVEALAQLPPVFEAGGTVTAGNSSRLSDGAAAVVVAGEELVRRLGLQPVAVVRGWGITALEPQLMGLGPVSALPLALKRAGLRLEDLAVVELNEAFAAQTLAVESCLGLDPERTNPTGGAIALGHPIGATGAILLVKLMYRLAHQGARYGAVTLCIGGGQGIALVVERLAA